MIILLLQYLWGTQDPHTLHMALKIDTEELYISLILSLKLFQGHACSLEVKGKHLNRKSYPHHKQLHHTLLARRS